MSDAHWTRTVEPVDEPISLDEAKAHLRIDVDDENGLVRGWIRAARQASEGYLGRALVTQTWQYTQEAWSDEIWLPMAAPLQSVSTVQYYAGDGTLTTLAGTAYVVDTASEPGRILRGPNKTWPTIQSDRLGPRVIVTYVCGWASGEAVPDAIKQGILLHIGMADARRSGGMADDESRSVHALWASVGRVWWRPPCETAA